MNRCEATKEGLQCVHEAGHGEFPWQDHFAYSSEKRCGRYTLMWNDEPFAADGEVACGDASSLPGLVCGKKPGHRCDHELKPKGIPYEARVTWRLFR